VRHAATAPAVPTVPVAACTLMSLRASSGPLPYLGSITLLRSSYWLPQGAHSSWFTGRPRHGEKQGQNLRTERGPERRKSAEKGQHAGRNESQSAKRFIGGFDKERGVGESRGVLPGSSLVAS